MKKNDNKLAKLTALVLLVTLVALVLVSGTYAKYTTSATGTDKARVAHWKIDATNNVSDLFADSYTNVKAGSSDLSIIAPGTSGPFDFTIDTNSVETAYTLKIDTTGSEDNVNGAVSGYNPIKYSFKTGAETAEDLTFAELLNKINAVGDGTTVHQPDDDFGTYTIGWKWVFNGEDDKDTELGNLVTSGDKTVSLSVKIVAAQVAGQ